MAATFIAPLLVALAAAVATSLVAPKHWPRASTAVLTLIAVISALSWTASSAIVAAAYLVEHTALHRFVEWCPLLADHHVTHWFGVAASISAAVTAVNVLRLWLRRRRDNALIPEMEEPLFVTQSDQPCAYAVPGNPGTVVVSTGMLRRLDPEGRRVLLAHEQAHLDHRHHIFTNWSLLAAAALPALVPISRAVHLAVENWADEEAVRAVGDRLAVARAIATAGLAQNENPLTSPRLALADRNVASRVQRLMAGPPGKPRLVGAAVLVTVLLSLEAIASGIQFHHFAIFVAHVCG